MPEYPDWQDFASWIGAPLVNVSQVFGVAATRFGPFRVDQWTGLHASVLISTGGVVGIQMVLTWWTDNTLSRKVGGRTWHTLTPAQLVISTDLNQGPVLTVDINAGSAGVTAAVVVYPTNQFEAPAPAIDDGLLLAREVTSVAGGGATTNVQINPYRGPVSVWFQTTAVAFAWSIFARNELNAIVGHMVNFLAAGGNLTNRIVHLPAHACYFGFTNNDAGAQTYTVSIVAIA
jgi:hypothetical protein